ncbi:hypothetical protein [Streptomyces candidus]|uniref:Uncharacterized protein n=2 Tax=Streptomyces candidus TaxID=67283 RepID=A0A7X0LT68_9ACTN|nr:hypothetical protein [Streptomyces candidus]MBB6439932.1 hypothetical protein [Streptomyces candidus]GHH57851.1 hypothetical protein GCM10018773_65780 [Streptomyces candidus]
MDRLAATSTEFVHVNVGSWINGTAITLADPPEFAFLLTTNNPLAEDWLTGEWSGNWARILVGPAGGAVTLAEGRYHVWLTFTAGLEAPVRLTGQLDIY